MQIKLKDEKKQFTTLLVLSIITVLVSAFCIFISDILLPICVALLSIVYLLDLKGKKHFSLVLSALLLILNTASLIFLNGILFSGFEAVVLGAIIFYCFSKNVSKAETAFLLCALSSLFIILNASFFAMAARGDYSIDAVKVFYSDFYNTVKAEMVSALEALKASVSESGGAMLLTEENVVLLLDSVVSLMVSYIVIAAFVVSGFTLKIFSFAASRLGNKELLYGWRFKTSNLFAYFYIALFVLQIFTAGHNGLFAVAVANLSYIFCVVYAYLGFNFALSFLSQKRSVAFSFVMLLVGFLLFSSFLVEILSIIGAFVTVSANKVLNKK